MLVITLLCIYPDVTILNTLEQFPRTVLSNPISQELGKVKGCLSFREKFRDDTPHREDVHGGNEVSLLDL